MSLQEVRSIAFVACSVVVGLIYPAVVWHWTGPALFAPAATVHAWAWPLLLYIPVQVIARILVFVGVLVVYKLRGGSDDPELEDEMDRAVDARLTRVLLNVILLCILAGLIALAAGLPAWTLPAALAGGIWLGSVLSDAFMVVLYRKGL